MTQKKKIIVTGSNGLLGQKLILALVKRADLITIATSKGENRMRWQEGYLYESLDITKKTEVENCIRNHRPDVVINTAAMTNVDGCESDKPGCLAMNVTSVQHIVDSLESIAPNTQLIHLSTDFVFDGERGSYTEVDIPNPLSYYAWSKLESEKVVQRSRLKWAIGRTSIVYGIVDNMSRTNIVLWAKEALSKGNKMNVVDDQFRSPTLSADLADCCIAIADKGATGIYHLSGPDTMSILELVYRVADFWKLDKSVVNIMKSDTLNQAAKRPPRTGFIIDKARKDLGYAPHSFEEGLAILDKELMQLA